MDPKPSDVKIDAQPAPQNAQPVPDGAPAEPKVDAAPAEPATPAAPAAGEPRPDLSNIPTMMSKAALAKLKEQMLAKGKADAMAEMDKAAQAEGFKDHADMVAAIKAAKADPQEPATPAKPAKPATGKEQAMLAEEKKARQLSDRRVRDLERQLDAQRTRAAIEREFILGGVKDVDYAVSLLERELADQTPEQAEAFEPGPWLTSLKAKRPYLFGEKVAPIDTVTPKPAPAAAAPTTAPTNPAAPPSSGVLPDFGAVDPKTGRFVMSDVEKNNAWARIQKGLGLAKEPIVPRN
jgi:hypothetical protein